MVPDIMYPVSDLAIRIKEHVSQFIPFPSVITCEHEVLGDKLTMFFKPSKNVLLITNEDKIKGASDTVVKWVEGMINDYISGFEKLSVLQPSPKLYSKYKFKTLRDLPDGVIYVSRNTYGKMCKDHISIGGENGEE